MRPKVSGSVRGTGRVPQRSTASPYQQEADLSKGGRVLAAECDCIVTQETFFNEPVSNTCPLFCSYAVERLALEGSINDISPTRAECIILFCEELYCIVWVIRMSKQYFGTKVEYNLDFQTCFDSGLFSLVRIQ